MGQQNSTLLAWVQGSLAVMLCLFLFVVSSAAAEPDKGAIPGDHAQGTFDVKLAPETAAADPAIHRMSIDKEFHGDLEGTSTGTMLSAGDFAKGNAGYVAIETVTGTLKGRTGSFALMHNATMIAGTGALNVIVVPGSGTGALAGLTGKMDIRVDAGKHSYVFDYTLPASH